MIDKQIEKQMNEQDELARRSAEEYANSHKEDISSLSDDKIKPSSGDFLTDKIVVPIANFTEKILKRFDKADGKETSPVQTKLTGGSSTEAEKKIKGFSKKHVIIIGTFLTVAVVLGVVFGTSSSSKKVKKEEFDLDRGAITGQHMTTMPKDYSELAAVKRRQQAEDERKKAEEEAKKKDKDKDKVQRDTRPLREQVRDGASNRTPPPRNDSEDRSRNAALEARIARENAILQQRQAAMSSPIGFDIKKR